MKVTGAHPGLKKTLLRTRSKRRMSNPIANQERELRGGQWLQQSPSGNPPLACGARDRKGRVCVCVCVCFFFLRSFSGQKSARAASPVSVMALCQGSWRKKLELQHAVHKNWIGSINWRIYKVFFFLTLAFVIRWAFASWTSFFFYPGLRDTMGICLLDQLHAFFFLKLWGWVHFGFRRA